MADENTQATGANTPAGEGTTQAGAADQSGQRDEAKTFTQDEVDAIVARRVARVKAQPPADYEDLKAKAAKWDEAQEAGKSELERAQGKAQKAAKDAADWKAKFEALQAEHERSEQVRAMATQYGVDADMLSRMTGDVEENAKYLKERADSVPKFGTMHDGGEQPPVTQTLDDIRKIQNPRERLLARAAYIADHPNG